MLPLVGHAPRCRQSVQPSLGITLGPRDPRLDEPETSIGLDDRPRERRKPTPNGRQPPAVKKSKPMRGHQRGGGIEIAATECVTDRLADVTPRFEPRASPPV